MKSKRNKINMAAAKVAEIEELVIEILLRVPAKPLLKLKCVSKQWLSLISDQQFCRSHTRLHQILNPKSPTYLLLDNYDNYYNNSEFHIIPLTSSPGGEISFKDLLKIPDAKILQSCNGLILCESNEQVDHRSSVVTDDAYFICNPITGQFRSLPYPRLDYENKVIYVGLAFDPKISLHYKIIFIFDLTSQDYLSDTSLTEIFIYSSETDSWTSQRRDVTNKERFCIYLDKSVFCNGAMHWVIHRPILPSHLLLCFDVDTMIFKKMSFPNTDHWLIWNCQESQGDLCIVAYEKKNLSQCHVLGVAADYSGWFVQYSFNLQSLRDAYPSKGLKIYSIFSFVLAKNVEELMFVIVVDGWAIAFNPLEGTSNKICEVKLTQRHGVEDSDLAINYTTHQFFDGLFWL